MNADDELLSAFLDGEATAEEAARIAGDPGLTQRLDALRAARDALAEAPVAIDPRHRDTAVAEAVRSRPTVLDRRRRPRRRVQLASIAAAVLAVIGLAGAIVLVTRGGHSSVDRAASTASPPPSSGEVSGGAPTAGSLQKSTAAAPGAPVDLGAYPDRDALVAALRQPGSFDLADANAAAADRAAQQTSTPVVPAGCASPDDLRLTGHALLAGQPVVVLVYGSPGNLTLDVRDPSCALLFTQPL